jgi:hypothetical protein
LAAQRTGSTLSAACAAALLEPSSASAIEVMGHSPAVHSDVYGSSTDNRVIDDAFEAGIKARAQKG